MKRWVPLVLIFSLVMMLAACGGKSADKGADTGTKKEDTKQADTSKEEAKTDDTKTEAKKLSGKITMATNRTDVVDTVFKEYGAKFKEKYPDVDVAFEAYADYAKDIKVRMASGDFPDVVLIPDIPTSDFPKYYEPLDYLGYDGNLHFQEKGSFEGKLYGIVDGVIPYGVNYNKKAFEKAGITVLPKTWDEFLATAEKLKAAGIMPIATNFKDAWPLSVYTGSAYILANDLSYTNNWVKTDTSFTPDSPYGKTIEMLRTLVEKGYTEPDLMSTNWDGSKVDFANAKIGMVYLGNWFSTQSLNAGGKNNPEDFGFFPMPLDNSGVNKVNLSPDWMYAVNKNSKNLEVAKEFLRFILEDSGYETYAGLISPIKTKVSSDPLLKEFLATNPEFISENVLSDDYTKVVNKAQIDTNKMIQDYVLTKDLKGTMDGFNKKWADAKKALGL